MNPLSMFYGTTRAVARALIGGCIFIYSCYDELTSFEISCH